jgi:hypothetical protein
VSKPPRESKLETHTLSLLLFCYTLSLSLCCFLLLNTPANPVELVLLGFEFERDGDDALSVEQLILPRLPQSLGGWYPACQCFVSHLNFFFLFNSSFDHMGCFCFLFFVVGILRITCYDQQQQHKFVVK